MSSTITIEGRLGRDPELTYGQTGTARCVLSVADDFGRKDQAGTWQKQGTNWYRVTLWRDMAENAADLVKGDMVIISGRLEQREYESNGETKRSIEVQVDTFGRSMRWKPRDGAASRPAPADDPWGNGGATSGNDEPPF